MHPRKWHVDASRNENRGHEWKEFTPYSNVLWIRYLYAFLMKEFKKKGDPKNLTDFQKITTELKRRLNVRTKVENGAFENAADVLQYIADKGWVSEEQLEGYGVDSTILSQ